MNTAQVADFEEGEKENCAIGGTEDGSKKDWTAIGEDKKLAGRKKQKGKKKRKDIEFDLGHRAFRAGEEKYTHPRDVASP